MKLLGVLALEIEHCALRTCVHSQRVQFHRAPGVQNAKAIFGVAALPRVAPPSAEGRFFV